MLWHPVFARDGGLAETATGGGDIVLSGYGRRNCAVNMLPTDAFIMPLRSKCSDGTTSDAGTACA